MFGNIKIWKILYYIIILLLLAPAMFEKNKIYGMISPGGASRDLVCFLYLCIFINKEQSVSCLTEPMVVASALKQGVSYWSSVTSTTRWGNGNTCMWLTKLSSTFMCFYFVVCIHR